MTRQRIIVLMGSKSDLPFAEKIGEFLENEGFKVKYKYTISSAHKTPDILLEKLRENADSGDQIVYITVAGLSDALSGLVAGFSTYPVIACPPDLEKFGCSKAFSTVMTPRGVSVLLTAKPENAALAAVKIFGLTEPRLRQSVKRYLRRKKDEVVQDDSAIGGVNAGR